MARSLIAVAGIGMALASIPMTVDALTAYGYGNCTGSSIYNLYPEPHWEPRNCSGTYVANIKLPDDYDFSTGLELVDDYNVVTLYYWDKVIEEMDNYPQFANIHLDENAYGGVYFSLANGQFSTDPSGAWHFKTELTWESGYEVIGDQWQWSFAPIEGIPEPGTALLVVPALLSLLLVNRRT